MSEKERIINIDDQSGLGYSKRMDKKISQYMADIGRKGGSVKSERKSNASRENGKRGGSPKKKLTI